MTQGRPLMNDANNAGTLLPCPFCGGRVHMADTGVSWVMCDDCGAEGPPGDNDPDAAVKWNTRADARHPEGAFNAGLQAAEDAVVKITALYREYNGPQIIEAIRALQLPSNAVRLDEAAIRKDEREKQREIDAKIAETCTVHDLLWRSSIATAILDGDQK